MNANHLPALCLPTVQTHQAAISVNVSLVTMAMEVAVKVRKSLWQEKLDIQAIIPPEIKIILPLMCSLLFTLMMILYYCYSW